MSDDEMERTLALVREEYWAAFYAAQDAQDRLKRAEVAIAQWNEAWK